MVIRAGMQDWSNADPWLQAILAMPRCLARAGRGLQGSAVGGATPCSHHVLHGTSFRICRLSTPALPLAAPDPPRWREWRPGTSTLRGWADAGATPRGVRPPPPPLALPSYRARAERSAAHAPPLAAAPCVLRRAGGGQWTWEKAWMSADGESVSGLGVGRWHRARARTYAHSTGLAATGTGSCTGTGPPALTGVGKEERGCNGQGEAHGPATAQLDAGNHRAAAISRRQQLGGAGAHRLALLGMWRNGAEAPRYKSECCQPRAAKRLPSATSCRGHTGRALASAARLAFNQQNRR